ncbi:hypothetical protein [Lactiplantibacillus songbeiensis]|uniref:Extracellular protein n=1 Tax=Lactiplantibacillus songbeiensis TaxID=2559920 RepID=A0ABW4C1L7_9LACO|nr:hypothetical protein [Lactiplantibacillus songbeiensis]
MSLNKLVIASLAGVSLLGGMVVTSTPAMAKSKTFKYYEGNDKVDALHKKYKSMDKYTLNKTFKVQYSGILKLNHLYVFHVSPKHSKYQTWVKVTGKLINKGYGQIALGITHTNNEGKYPGVINSHVSLKNAVPFKAAQSISYGPIGCPFYEERRVNSKSSQSFDLILHTKQATKKLGTSTLVLRTAGIPSDGSKVANNTKVVKLNLN